MMYPDTSPKLFELEFNGSVKTCSAAESLYDLKCNALNCFPEIGYFFKLKYDDDDDKIDVDDQDGFFAAIKDMKSLKSPKFYIYLDQSNQHSPALDQLLTPTPGTEKPQQPFG